MNTNYKQTERRGVSGISVNRVTEAVWTRSHPEMVGDMSCVTLNFDLSKIPFVHLFLTRVKTYTHTKN